MPNPQEEALATVRILVHVAKADGTIAPEERAAIAAALEGVKLPAGTTINSLIDAPGDLDAQLKSVATPDAKQGVYNAAYGMVNADGKATPEEKALLERIRSGLGIPVEHSNLLGRVFSEAKDTVLPSDIHAIHDAAQRAKEITEDTRKYAIFSAILGAFPIPGVAIATDLAVVGIQIKLIRDIGQYHGHHVTKEAAKSLLLGVGVGTGARIAVTNVVKLVPGWGSAVGAVTSYAATWAIGRMADNYFGSGGKADMDTLKSVFKSAEAEGKKAYESDKAAIEAKKKADKAKIEALNADLKAGKISQAEYEAKVAALA